MSEELFTVRIVLLLIVLPLLCITALVIMFVKRVKRHDDGKKAKSIKVIKNILTSVLILNYMSDIYLGLEMCLNIIRVSAYDIISVLMTFYLLLEIPLIVSVLVLLCNLIRVIVKKTNESWKRIILYILICLIAIVGNYIIFMFMAAW